MFRSFWVQAPGVLERPRTLLWGAVNRAPWRGGIVRGTGYRIWRRRIKTAPVFRSFWVQAQGVLEPPRTLLWGLARSQLRWGISTGMGSRTWRWLITVPTMFRSCSILPPSPALSLLTL